MFGSIVWSFRGSSPRVRGKLPLHIGVAVGLGLIPARAGKTSSRPVTRPGTRAHPRACGENTAVRARSSADHGSSPRVRGKRFLKPDCQVMRRLIPARAGKTLYRANGFDGDMAHPRACGENVLVSGGEWVAAGSSPRVRGKPRGRRPCSRTHRLIPARAGKTDADPYSRDTLAAHPRACGENKGLGNLIVASVGSSPRVRGKRR